MEESDRGRRAEPVVDELSTHFIQDEVNSAALNKVQTARNRKETSEESS